MAAVEFAVKWEIRTIICCSARRIPSHSNSMKLKYQKNKLNIIDKIQNIVTEQCHYWNGISGGARYLGRFAHGNWRRPRTPFTTHNSHITTEHVPHLPFCHWPMPFYFSAFFSTHCQFDIYVRTNEKKNVKKINSKWHFMCANESNIADSEWLCSIKRNQME